MPAVNGVGKPCAGEPHARFDGRELETEPGSDQGHGDEGHQGKPCGHQRLRDLPPILVTAPALDPTSVALIRCRRGRKCAEVPLKADRNTRVPAGGSAHQYPFRKATHRNIFLFPLGVVQHGARSEQRMVDLVIIDEDCRSVERDNQRVIERRVDVGVLCRSKTYLRAVSASTSITSPGLTPSGMLWTMP